MHAGQRQVGTYLLLSLTVFIGEKNLDENFFKKQDFGSRSFNFNVPTKIYKFHPPTSLKVRNKCWGDGISYLHLL